MDGVNFVFHICQSLYDSLEEFKDHFYVLFNYNLSDPIDGALYEGEKSSRSGGLEVKLRFWNEMFSFVKSFLELQGIDIVLKGAL